MCEDRLPHDHPFIKIVKPENSPTAIFTAVNENPEQPEQPLHQFENEEERVHRGHRGGRGGRGHRGRGCHFGANFVNMIAKNFMMGRAQTEGN